MPSLTFFWKIKLIFCVNLSSSASFRHMMILEEDCRGDCRGGSKIAATSKMEHFVIIVNGWKPLTVITKSSILDVAAILDSPFLTKNCISKLIDVTNVPKLAYIYLCPLEAFLHDNVSV